MLNLAVGVHNKRDAIRKPTFGEDSILARHFALEVAQEGKGEVQVLVSPMFKSRQVVDADAQYLCIYAFKICDTTLVRSEFLCSTTGKRRREKRHNDIFLPAVIG